jgi:hypothetical protein
VEDQDLHRPNATGGRLAAVRALPLLAAVLVLAACGGGGDATTSAERTTSTTRSTAEGKAVTTTEPGVDAVTTTVAGRSTTTTSATRTAAAASAHGPAPLAPGTYHYRQSGTASGGGQSFDSPPEGTMVVKPAEADGAQLLQRYIDPKGDPQDVRMRFGDEGMFILEMVLRMGGNEVRCTFDAPVPSPAWPPAEGKTSKGHGSCGSFEIDVDDVITGTHPVTLDGASYTAFVVESTIKTTGSVTSTSHQTDWFVPELRMATHSETDTQGSFGAVSFTSRSTSDLLSATPT